MIRRLLWLLALGVYLGGGAGSLRAQDQTQPPNRPTKLDSLRNRLLPRSSLAFPADTDTTFARDSLARDTTPRIDIQAERDSLAGGEFPQRDDRFQKLAGLGGFRIIEYRGRQVQLQAQRRVLRLGGDAQANYGDDVLRADTIAYLADLRFMRAHGDIHLLGADQKEVTSDSVLYYDVSSRKGTILGARAQFAQMGANWYVRGNAIPQGQDTLYVSAGSFTSCDLEEPHYYFKAHRIKMVSQNVIVAWPVVLYVHEVPVFWFPFFAQDIRPGRHSGILPPRFGVNDVVRTSSGYSRQVSDFGYYWAIDPYMDAQATVDWFSGNYTRLNGAFRYRVLKDFLRGNVNSSYSFGNQGRNLEVDWNHDQEFSPSTSLKVSGRYVKNTNLLQDRSFDPNLQTQTIDSDVGLVHQFSFANLSVSARRRQFLSQAGQTQLTLPAVNLTFSPVTLFPAPRGRGGLFNNLSWNGSANFSREDDHNEQAADRLATTAGANSRFTLSNFSLSGSGNLNDLVTTPIDSTGADLANQRQTTMTWQSQADYRLGLMGSTALRPTVSVSGALFRSPDTGDSFVTAPSRISVGASLSTDLYAFLPGIGPYSRIRHKISPRFDWAYSPEVVVDSSLASIPGFPGASGQARNVLTVSLSQTFEAKVRPKRPAPSVSAGEGGTAADTTSAAAVGAGVGPDSTGARSDTTASRASPRAPPEERKVVLLSINTSPLQFDFERAKQGEPVLVTDQLRNSFNSDLLRGLTIQMTHDLFRGTGASRTFSPFLSQLSASFSLHGGGGATPPVSRPEEQRLTSRNDLSRFDNSPRFGSSTRAGPWDLSVSYSLQRSRPGEPGLDNQTVSGNLSLQPTPNWRVRWSTQYSFTQKEFGQHFITLDRDLHRWVASFQFARAPNGNFLFQVLIQLKDAPDVKVNYDERSNVSP